jgi:cytoskeleton protein RodZ
MSEAAATLGQRMKAERERKGLSAQKVADELHLDAWVVDALESGDYARVGPSVYAKGHLKRYAEILGLPPAEIVEAYSSQPAEPPPPPPAPSMRMATSAPTGSEIPWLQMAGFAVVAAGLAGILWWKPWHPRGSTPAATAVPVQPTAGLPGGNAPADAAASAEAAGADAVAPALPARDGPRGAAPTSSDRAGPAGPAAAPGATRAGAPSLGAGAGRELTPALATAAATAGAGRARLRLSFSADSWVDVRDAAGQRVFVGNGRANSVRTIAGAAPLRVYLRSASGVQLEINNHAVAIGPQYVVGNVAHFEAGADGVLRRDTHAAAPRPRG